MERHLSHPASNEKFIRDSQGRERADLTAAHRHTPTRTANVVRLLSRESRASETIRTSHAVNKGLLEIDTDRTVIKEDRNNGFVPADVLHCSGVLRPAPNSGVDVVMLIKVRTHGLSLGTAEFTAVSQAVFDKAAYVPTSLSDVASAGEEPSPDSAKAPGISVPPTLDALSVRQQDVLRLMVRGMSNKEIARALKLAEGTVKIHAAALFRKLGIRGRTAAAVVGAQLLSQAAGLG
jgi:DNA-binding CsgD family transcriptional regulator